MSRTIKVHLSDEAYAELQRKAHLAGSSPSDEAAASLEDCFGGRGAPSGDEDGESARERFERHFGEVDLGCPTGTDNETIDADLAAEYSSTHEQT